MASVINSLVSYDVQAPLGSSDHYTVQVTLHPRQPPKKDKPPSKKIWLYKRANPELANQLLRKLPLATPDDDIDVYWGKWISMFMEVMDQTIPCKYVPVKSATPWITNDIRKDIAKKERLFRKAKRSKCNDHLQQFKRIRNSIVNKIRNAKRAFLKTLSQPGTTTKSFWTVIRSVNPRKSLSSGILSYGTIAVTNIQDKANLLNEYFSACFHSTFVPSTVKPSPIPSELILP